ncbi:hypothetical protein [uncultured Erythrobacter sp.]|uniref:hypothetical protein n=1 Tax=uncultured Erythrobacter sp. TaxID=263913 RepID=UPI00262421CF|nr:hypothetical protein [uncultured Erythrobacter sp.]
MAQLNRNRAKLLLGCGAAAMATGLAMAPERASAQAIQATESVTSGSANRVFTGTGTETIVVQTDTAVIQWTPDEDGAGNALDFLPQFNAVTFQNGVNNADFAVLNIVLPSANDSVTVFDGTLISQLVDPGTGAVSRGGTVAFYSPSGIFVGDNAVFDVGNLILTTLEPDLASFDDFALNGGQLQLTAIDPAGQNIIIQPGAQFTATAENSYFAVISLEVQMFGTADINGSHAYVAGEQVNVTVSNGLFDIQIPVGTSATTPVILDGDIGGPSSTGAGDNHMIYAVAAAQNDPIAMIFRGNLGFDPAASAGIVNGEIILSANYAVSGRDVDGGSISDGVNAVFDGNTQLTNTPGSIFLEGFTSTSSVLAIANEEVQVSSFIGDSSIDGNLLMVGRNFAELTSAGGFDFTINGDVLVSARDFGETGVSLNDPNAINAQGGDAFIDAFDGTMTINGTVVVTADAFAGADLGVLASGTATGGIATIAAGGGTLTINGDSFVTADAAQERSGDLLSGGDVTGGTAQVFANNNGLLTTNGSILLSAGASSASMDTLGISSGVNVFGGAAILQALDGGTIDINGVAELYSLAFAGASNNPNGNGAIADSGSAEVFIGGSETIDIEDALILEARAIGGNNFGGRGGDGLGGAARGFVPNGGNLLVGGDFFSSATGRGGNGIGGGSGFGGIAGIQVVSGTLDITGLADIDSTGFGGNASIGFGGDGGLGEGGNSSLQANGTANVSASITVGGDVGAYSDGFGGTGGAGDGSAIEAGRGGDAIGGQNVANQAASGFSSGTFLLSDRDNATYSVGGTVFASSNGVGGQGGAGGTDQDGGDGGDGSGGFVQVGHATLSGTTTIGDGNGTADFGDIDIFSDGVGGNGGAGNGTDAIAGNGGIGQGGGSFFSAIEGDVTAGNVDLSSEGAGGDGHVGGNGSGGLVSLLALDQGLMAIGGVLGSAAGNGGDGDLGGEGIGGQAMLTVTDAQVTVTNNLSLDAGAFGGNGAIDVGGAATGGLAEIVISGPNASVDVGGNVPLSAGVFAGFSSSASDGAVGTAGEAHLLIENGGSMTIGTDLFISTLAIGGGNGGSGAGGLANGGTSTIDIQANSTLIVGDEVEVEADGFGGDGQGGGDGLGGIASARVLDGTFSAGGNVLLRADGIGGTLLSLGAVGVGGAGDGGIAEISIEGSAGTFDAVVDVSLLARGTAGDSNSGADAASATGGSALVMIENTGTMSVGRDLFADTNATAGDNDGTGAGGVAIGGGSTIDVQGNSSLGVGRDLLIDAEGTGGDGTGGGDAFGGFAGIRVGAGQIDITGRARANAGGFGGDSIGIGGDGGTGHGGRATIVAAGTQTETGMIAIGGDAQTRANGRGGSGGDGDGANILAGRGGDGIGGDELDVNAFNDGEFNGASIIAGGDNGSLSVGGFALILTQGAGGVGGAGGAGQDGGDGGDGTGGSSTVGLTLIGTDGSVGAGVATFGDILLTADGTGGNGGLGGGTGTLRGDGGTGTSGLAAIFVDTGSLSGGNIRATANAIGGSGENGGEATNDARNRNSTFFKAVMDTVNGGTIQATGAQLISQGVGGNADGSAGGRAIGGAAFIDVTDGTIDIDGDVILDTSGFGGSSSGGDGGDGFGGRSDLSAFRSNISGDATVSGNAAVIANGVGGASGIGGSGGFGQGGLSTIEAHNGSTITLGSAQVTSSGQGGVGDAAGGDGFGGSTFVRSRDQGSQVRIQLNTPQAFSDALNRGAIISSNGFGGDTTGGSGIGGSALGGDIEINVSDGGDITLPPDPANDPNSQIGNGIQASAFGGGSSVDGGVGGTAQGGFVTISADNASIDLGQVIISSFANGGSSLNSNLDISGGDAIGGERLMNLTNGGDVEGEFIGGSSGANGGDGSGTGNGGNATAGGEFYDIIDSTLTTFGNSLFTTSSSGGDGGINGNGGNVTSGFIEWNVTNSVINILTNANGEAFIQIGEQVFGGNGVGSGGDASSSTADIQFSNSTISSLAYTSQPVGVDGTLTIFSEATGGDALGDSTTAGEGVSGGIQFGFSGGAADLFGVNSLRGSAQGGNGVGGTGGTATGGDVFATFVNSDLTILAANSSPGTMTLHSDATGGNGGESIGDSLAGSASFSGIGGTFAFDELLLTANAASGTTATGVSGGNAEAGSTFVEFSDTVNVDIFTVSLFSDAVSSIDGLTSGGTADVLIGSTDVVGAPQVNIDELNLSASGSGANDDSGVPNVSGEFSVVAQQGQLAVNDLNGFALGDRTASSSADGSSVRAIGGDILISGNMTIDVLDDFTVETSQGRIVGGPDQLDPTAIVDVQSQAIINILGDDDNHVGFGGAVLNLTSNDIVIANGARIGAPIVNLVSINADDPAVLGGVGTPDSDATGEGYSAIAEELQRIDVTDFTFTQDALPGAGSNDPDIIIRDTVIAGSLDDGVSSVTINATGSGGIIRVDGLVQWNDAAETDQLSLLAGGRIEVVTPGGLFVLNPNGDPGGNIFLGSDNIWIADSDLIALLQDDSLFSGRDDQLRVAASGSDDPLGFVRASGVSVEAGVSFLVRNTGTETAQGGILVGDGGLSIFAPDSATNAESGLDVFAYGARIDGQGNLITGEDFFGEVNFNNDGSSTSTFYSGTSEFNDCLINTGVCPDNGGSGGGPDPVTPEPENSEVSLPINNPNIIEDPITSVAPVPLTEAEADTEFGIDFPGLMVEPEDEEEGTIDDPVSSGGDSSLYGPGATGSVRVEGN